MSVEWPSAILPIILEAGYSYSGRESVIRTEFDTGHIRARRRFTAQKLLLGVSWRMTDAQMAIFDAWWYHDAELGAEWITGLTVRVAYVAETMTARFLAEPTRSLIGGQLWEMSAQIEVDQPSRQSLSEYDSAVALALQDADAWDADVAQLYEIIHTEYPTE